MRSLAGAILAAAGGAGAGLYFGCLPAGAALAVLLWALESRGRDPLGTAWAYLPGALVLALPLCAAIPLPETVRRGFPYPAAGTDLVRLYAGGLLLLAAFALSAFVRVWRRPKPPVGPSGPWGRRTALGALLFAAVFSALSCLAFRSFHKYIDLAIENEVVWRLAFEGRPVSLLHASMPNHAQPNYWSYHLAVVWALVAPAYRLLPSPCLLLTLQAALVGAAAIPIYLCLKDRLGPLQSAGLAGAYLLYPTTQHAVLHELHSLTWAAPFVVGSWWAARSRRWATSAVLGLAALACREDAALAGVGAGLALLCERRTRLAGALAVLAFSAWFAFAVTRLMPGLGESQDWRNLRFASLGATNAEILSTLLTRPLHVAGLLLQPAKLVSAAMFLVPLACLPLLGGRYLLAAAPLFLVLFLSDSVAAYSYLLFYTLPVLPFLVLGCGEALLRLERWGGAGLRWAAWSALLAASAAATVLFGPSPLGLTFWDRGYQLGYFTEPYHHRSVYAQTAHAAVGRRLIEGIPSGAVVSAQAGFLPHLARTRRMLNIPQVEGADWVLVDARHSNRYELPAPGEYEAFLSRMGSDPRWRLEREEDGYRLYRPASREPSP